MEISATVVIIYGYKYSETNYLPRPCVCSLTCQRSISSGISLMDFVGTNTITELIAAMQELKAS
jgi:hypothetical protein